MRGDDNRKNQTASRIIPLPRGATLISSPMKNMYTASVGVFIAVGSRQEKTDEKGLAHFLEHMIFKGSRRYSSRRISREIEGRGGSLNGFTSQEVTAYYAQVLKDNTERTLDILLDMVLSPLLERKELEKERNVILEEIKMHNDLPHIRVNSLLESLIWKNHPLGEDIIGTHATVGHIQRKNLDSFRKHFYHPAGMIIACAGDYCEAAVTRKIKKFFAHAAPVKPASPFFPPRELRKKDIVVERKDIGQAHLSLGFRGFSCHSPHRFALDLIHIILGANMSSRLFEKIREKKGLCYDISTDVCRFQDSGAFTIHLGLAAKNVPTAIRSILKELLRMKDTKVTASELRRAQDYCLGQIQMGLERPQGRMLFAADSYRTLKKIYTLEELQGFLQSVSPEDIRAVARRVFDFERFCISCITPPSGVSEEAIRSAAAKV